MQHGCRRCCATDGESSWIVLRPTGAAPGDMVGAVVANQGPDVAVATGPGAAAHRLFLFSDDPG